MIYPTFRPGSFGWATIALLLCLLIGPAVTAQEVEGTAGQSAADRKSAAPAASPADGQWMQQVVQQAADSVVLITVEGRDGRQAGLGSGFIVSADGLVATNLHVIGQGRPITVCLHNGKRLPVTQVYASDRQLDLAVVRVDAHGLRPLALAGADQQVSQGQPIIALGNPMGLRHSVVSGVVSGQREIDGHPMIQIALPIEPGNSGGPLLDNQGRVVGIVTLKSAITANLGFAQPASALATVLTSPNPVAMRRWMTIGSLRDDDWSTVFGARWQLRSGQILVSEIGDSFGGRALCLWKGTLPDKPFEFGAYVRLDDESGAAGLVFDSDGHDRHYGFYPSGGRLRLTRFDGPTVYSWQILEEFSSPHYRPGKWNHLKIRLEGEHVTAYVNDQQVVQRRLSTPVSGQVGLAKFRDTHASFRQFTVAPQLAPTQLDPSRLDPIRERIAEISDDGFWGDDFIDKLAADADASQSALQDRADQLRQEAQRLTQLASDVHVRQTCQKLSALFQKPEGQISLAEAALLVSRLDNRELDIAAYLDQLDQMAREIREPLEDASGPAARLAALNRYLFEDNGFHGSRTQYYQAVNSYFDRVLDDREGLPITLSILYLELADRLGLNVQGVGLPGHFVVRFTPPEGESQLIDVFDGGKPLSLTDARRISLATSGEPLDESQLSAADKRTIVLRVLRNLQGIAQQNQDSEALLRYVEAMVSLAPDEASYRGMRAVVRYETGRKRAAVADLDWFLDAAPPGVDLQSIRDLKQRFTDGM
jgi:regulator of sirC expression with transglutaminase-like and TPR domain/S1-C subfamily serine protease